MYGVSTMNINYSNTALHAWPGNTFVISACTLVKVTTLFAEDNESVLMFMSLLSELIRTIILAMIIQ